MRKKEVAYCQTCKNMFWESRLIRLNDGTFLCHNCVPHYITTLKIIIEDLNGTIECIEHGGP